MKKHTEKSVKPASHVGKGHVKAGSLGKKSHSSKKGMFK